MATKINRGDLCIIETAHSYAGVNAHGGGRYHSFQLCEVRSINVRGIVIRATANSGPGFMVNKHLPQRVFVLSHFDHDAARSLVGTEWDSQEACRAALAPYRNKIAA